MDLSYPDLWNLDNDELWPRYYPIQLWISCFPERLVDEAYANQPFLFYREARDKGFLDDYLAIEAKYLDLYQRLVGDGDILFLRKFDRKGYRFDRYKRFRGFRSEVRRRLTRVIREQSRHDDDMYIPALRLRVYVGWDFSHFFLPEDEAALPVIRAHVAASGLHILAEDRAAPA